MDKMRRVLAPGGRLMILDGFRDNVVGWIAFDVIMAIVEKHVELAAWTQMRDYFRQAGLANIRHRKFSFWMPLLLTTGDVAGSSGAARFGRMRPLCSVGSTRGVVSTRMQRGIDT